MQRKGDRKRAEDRERVGKRQTKTERDKQKRRRNREKETERNIKGQTEKYIEDKEKDPRLTNGESRQKVHHEDDPRLVLLPSESAGDGARQHLTCTCV